MQSLTEISAAILAGGLGTRLRPVVSDRPKVLAPVRGRPFLSYLLDQLEGVGIKSVVLCTGYMGDLVQAEFGSSYRSLALTYSRELAPLGTAGALRLALPFISSKQVLILNGDSYCEMDFPAFWHSHMSSGANLSIVLVPKDTTERYGRVTIDDNGRILKFDEKKNSAGPGWVNGGVYLINADILRLISSNRQVSLENEIFPALIGKPFFGIKSDGRFLDIGTADSFALVEDFFSGVHPVRSFSRIPD